MQPNRAHRADTEISMRRPDVSSAPGRNRDIEYNKQGCRRHRLHRPRRGHATPRTCRSALKSAWRRHDHRPYTAEDEAAGLPDAAGWQDEPDSTSTSVGAQVEGSQRARACEARRWRWNKRLTNSESPASASHLAVHLCQQLASATATLVRATACLSRYPAWTMAACSALWTPAPAMPSISIPPKRRPHAPPHRAPAQRPQARHPHLSGAFEAQSHRLSQLRRRGLRRQPLRKSVVLSTAGQQVFARCHLREQPSFPAARSAPFDSEGSLHGSRRGQDGVLQGYFLSSYSRRNSA